MKVSLEASSVEHFSVKLELSLLLKRITGGLVSLAGVLFFATLALLIAGCNEEIFA